MSTLVKTDARYGICFAGSFMVESTGFIIFSIYLLIWVTSFVDGGVFETFQDAKLEYKDIMTYALVITLCVTPIAGKMADLILMWILSVESRLYSLSHYTVVVLYISTE